MNIITTKQDRITTIVINRPEVRNAVDGPTAGELAEAFREFDADDTADVAVLTGAGGNFCAGADLKAISSVHTITASMKQGMPPWGLQGWS